MKYLFDITHPAHVHLFKHLISSLKCKGHEVLVTTRNKEATHDLLKKYDIEYTSLSNFSNNGNLLTVLLEWLIRDIKLLMFSIKHNPDILIGMHNPCITHAAKLLGKRSIILTDTEHATLANYLTFPFADAVLTPVAYHKNIGKKQVKYNGYHELAYLHPNYFSPNPRVLDLLNVDENETYIILRFVSWGAHHDVGQHGIDDKISLINELSKFGNIFISSEGPLPRELEHYRITISPEQMHDALYYASLYIGEGATMASESAVLGTPSIYVNSLSSLGILEELQNTYGLIKIFRKYNKKTVIDAVNEYLSSSSIDGYKISHIRLLKEKIDVTKFLEDFIEKIEKKIYI